jgi:hypothetical protein
MPPVISDDDLRGETDTTINEQVAGLYAAGNTDRDVITAVAVTAMHAAEDAAYRLRTWLADGWNGNPDHLPDSMPSTDDRDRQLLAAMVAATNAAALAGAVRRRQGIERPACWDPLRLPRTPR